MIDYTKHLNNLVVHLLNLSNWRFIFLIICVLLALLIWKAPEILTAIR